MFRTKKIITKRKSIAVNRFIFFLITYMITVMEIRHVVSPLVTVVLFRNVGPKTREKYSREGTIESTLKKINNK